MQSFELWNLNVLVYRGPCSSSPNSIIFCVSFYKPITSKPRASKFGWNNFESSSQFFSISSFVIGVIVCMHCNNDNENMLEDMFESCSECKGICHHGCMKDCPKQESETSKFRCFYCKHRTLDMTSVSSILSFLKNTCQNYQHRNEFWICLM